MTPELLDILCCPETRQPLRLAGPELIERLNRALAAGSLLNRRGQPVAEPLTAGLIRQDGRFLYPIFGTIPVMLVDEAIPLPPAAH